MIELFSNLNWVEIGNSNIATIIIFGLIGTFSGYLGRWAWSKDNELGIGSYMFGSGKAVARATLTLGAAIATMYATGIHEGMDFPAAAYAGFLGGLAVPQRVEDRQKELEEERQEKFKKFTDSSE